MRILLFCLTFTPALLSSMEEMMLVRALDYPTPQLNGEAKIC